MTQEQNNYDGIKAETWIGHVHMHDGEVREVIVSAVGELNAYWAIRRAVEAMTGDKESIQGMMLHNEDRPNAVRCLGKEEFKEKFSKNPPPTPVSTVPVEKPIHGPGYRRFRVRAYATKHAATFMSATLSAMTPWDALNAVLARVGMSYTHEGVGDYIVEEESSDGLVVRMARGTTFDATNIQKDRVVLTPSSHIPRDTRTPYQKEQDEIKERLSKETLVKVVRPSVSFNVHSRK